MCLFVWFLNIGPFPHRVQWFLLNNPFTAFLWVVPCYDFPSTQCIRIHIFSSTTLHVASGDGFFGTQKTLKWILYSINLHVALSVVCSCMVFALYIPNINMITLNNMSLRYIFHVTLHVTFFTLFLVLQVFFFYNPDFNNQNGNVWNRY